MSEVEKLQQELYDKKWLLTKAQVVRIARFVMRREIEARLETTLKYFNDDGYINIKCSDVVKDIAELRKQLEK